jgi:hypothetical protein
VGHFAGCTAGSLCQKFLVATRRVRQRDGKPIDMGWAVTHTSDRRYWLVQDAEGGTVWEGDACCAYAARTEALMKLANSEPTRFASDADRQDFDTRR